jgi:hypothetical protein
LNVIRLASIACAALVLTLPAMAGCSADPEGTGTHETLGGGGVSTSGMSNGGSSGLSGSAGFAMAGGSSGGVSQGGTSGGAAGTGAPGVEASFATVRQVVVQAHCADASCHNGEVKPRLQDDATLHATLTTHVSKACGNIPVVTPGNPEQSALVKLIKGPCGELPRMPNGCVSTPIEEYTCLPPDYIDAIERWVKNGAPQ